MLSLRFVPVEGALLQYHTMLASLFVIATGVALGYWMFGWRGMLLFGSVAAAIVVAVHFLSRWSMRVASASALLLAAAALYPASTLGWGGGDAPDGTRFKASPVGLSHVLQPQQPQSPTDDCGWYAVSGYTKQCEVAQGGNRAFALLKTVYPLVWIAILVALLGAGSIILGKSSPVAALAAPVVAAILVLAVVLFAITVNVALAELSGVPVGVGGSLGTMLITTSMLLSLALWAVHLDAQRGKE
jgi:hypothetical protein